MTDRFWCKVNKKRYQNPWLNRQHFSYTRVLFILLQCLFYRRDSLSGRLSPLCLILSLCLSVWFPICPSTSIYVFSCPGLPVSGCLTASAFLSVFFLLRWTVRSDQARDHATFFYFVRSMTIKRKKAALPHHSSSSSSSSSPSSSSYSSSSCSFFLLLFFSFFIFLFFVFFVFCILWGGVCSKRKRHSSSGVGDLL